MVGRVGHLGELVRKMGCGTVQMPGVETAPELPQKVFHEDSNKDYTDVFMCKLFLLLTHVVAPGNYRVKGIKKDIISPHQSLTVLHLHLTLAARLSAFTGATLISVT